MLTLLKANPLALKAIAIAAVLGLALLGVQELRISWLKADLAHAKSDVALLEADQRVLVQLNDQCADAVIQQNAAIDKMQADQAAREAEAVKQMQAADKRAAKFEADASELKKRPMPVAGDECASLEVLLNDEIWSRQ